MRFRRTTLLANVVIIGATLPAVTLPTGAPSSAALPAFEYTTNGAATTWSSQTLTARFNGHKILGNVRSVKGDGEVAFVARLDDGDVGLYVKYASGTSSFHDVTSLADSPPASADPNAFLDPWGNVDIVYISKSNRLILISNLAASSPRQARIAGTTPPPYVVTDLSARTHVPISPGLPSVSVSGTSGEIFDRSTKGDAIAIPVQWSQLAVLPQFGAATDVSLATNSPTLLNDPVSMAGVTNAFAATTSAGHVEYFSQALVGTSPWTVTDVSVTDDSGFSNGQVEIATTGTATYLATLNAPGHVQLFSLATPTTAKVALGVEPWLVPHTSTPTPTSRWKYIDLTADIAGSPLWAGNIFLGASATAVNVAGRAQNWGDIYDFSLVAPATTWTSTDVSQDADTTTAATADVNGVQSGATVELFATGNGTVSPHGTGVYAIPAADWSRAVTDGWPIISETGGLGALKAPWVQFTSTSSVVHSPDYLMGKSILASKKRETWLSFWTVSGPLAPADQTASSYYSHGFLAGQWVAQQIDQYHLHGVNIKPNWVILDPEGYPDNHSALDAPGGSSKATLKKYATYWTAMLSGWATGIRDVDATLRPGIYTEMSQYANYGLSSSILPNFEALAFGGGGPLRIPGSNGHNILGYIAFNATCTPTSALHSQEQTLVGPPWSGQFNTLQFNSGVYCAP
ncbi:MAG TPA: hypothetical protein VIJ86_09840 [Acidimicrobiales bacterium]